jgi:hypothetical protein
MKKTLTIVLGSMLIISLAGCGKETDDGGDGQVDDVVEISGSLTADTTWTADKTYILTGLTYVEAPATLTVQAGTVVQGDNGSALVVTRGARIVANGTKDDPIVFTSSSMPGERRSGDWGGLVLLGRAAINITGGENKIEGIDPSEDRGAYGGGSSPDSAHDCGSLRYVRIEFAGFELSIDNELNGLSLGACGTGTTLEYVQVHKGKDDGIEFFGGSVRAKHVLITQAEDDSIDWDLGFNGGIQFLAIQQNPSDADAAFEADNQSQNNDALPRSQPTIYNATLIGTNAAAGTQNGMVLRRGTWGELKNFIVMGFPVAGVDVRDAAGTVGMQMMPPELTIESSLFHQNAANFDADAEDDDGGFDEAAFLSDAARANKLDVDPMLGAPYDLATPDFVPAAGSPAASGAATPPSGFDPAPYIGAFAPGGEDWTDGWATFAPN